MKQPCSYQGFNILSILLIKLQELALNLPESAVVESTSVAGPGFLNVVLSTLWIEQV